MMKSKAIFSISFLLITAFAAAMSVAAQDGRTQFSGSIGTAKFEMDVTRSGGNLNGTYFYRKSGSANKLTVTGTIGSDGKFTLRESDPSGKMTGELRGTWTNEPNEPGASIEGEWLKPGQVDGGTGFYAYEQMIYFTTTKIIAHEYKEAIKPKKAELSAEYPVLSGNPGATGFNALAKARVMASLAAFRKDLGSLTAADIRRMGTDMGNYIEIGYDVTYADDSLISISFGEDTFEGGAHPNHDFFTLTYDLRAGREVKLVDLFKPGAKYLTTIANYCKRDLQGRKMPDSGESMELATDIWEDGVNPTAANFQDWNLTKKGLEITFSPYQVGPYAAGPQWVIIPFAELKSIARADGVMAKLSK